MGVEIVTAFLSKAKSTFNFKIINFKSPYLYGKWLKKIFDGNFAHRKFDMVFQSKNRNNGSET